MATSNAYLSDPFPSTRPRLSALIHWTDGTGANPSGITPAYAADIAGFFACGNTYPVAAVYSMDNLIAAGVKRVVFNRPWGDRSAAEALLNIPGHYPHTYPVTGTAGGVLQVTPNNQVQSETAFGNTNFTVALKAAFDTAARLGRLYGAACYDGPVHANVDPSSTSALDAHSAFARDTGMDQMFDVMSVISDRNTAPPAILGANCLGWWEANRQSYTDSGTTQATNGQGVYHWDSLFGTSSWANSTTTQQPVFTANAVNGYPAMQFDSVTFRRWTNASPISPGAAFTVSMVVKPTGNDEILMSAAAGATNRQVRFNESAAGRISYFDGTNVTVAASSSFTANAWSIVTFRHTGTVCRIYVNGTQVGYFVGPLSASNMILSMLGAFGNGGASNFFTGQLAALSIMNANATDNQIGLIEAYWASKYGITVATTAFGSPVLPHKAFVERMNTTYGHKVYREDYNYRTIAELSDWDSIGKGIVTSYSEFATSLAAAATLYTKASIGAGQRARVLIPASGAYTTVAARMAAVVVAAGLGYDVDLDFDGFTNQEITNTLTNFASYATPGGGETDPDPGAPTVGGLPEPLLRLG